MFQPPVPGTCFPKVSEDPGSPFGSNFFQEQQDPIPANAVVGVVDNLEVGKHILDVGGIHEFESAYLDKGNTFPPQFDFKVKRVKTRPEQHRDPVEADTFKGQVPDVVDNESGLAVFVRRPYQARAGTAFFSGKESLGVFISSLVDNLVGQV